MDKILIIIAREYLTRVRKRSFIIMSVLGPVLIALVYTLPILLVGLETKHTTVKVLDESFLKSESFRLKNSSSLEFIYVSGTLSDQLGQLNRSSADGLLYIPAFSLDSPTGMEIFSDATLSISVMKNIEGQIEAEIYERRLAQLDLDREAIRQLRPEIDLRTESITSTNSTGETQTKETNVVASMVVGGIASGAIYILVILYGSMVMRGIVEEKTNRIVEVIVSTVQPFQLMMGKIIGIAGVGLTQLLIWLVLGLTLVIGVSIVFGGQMAGDVPPEALEAAQSGEAVQLARDITKALDELNLSALLISFLFYFIFGYLMYAALFGAVGAIVDQETDSQQFTLPVLMPLIIAFMVIGQVISEPNGSIAFWFSMIPLTSPVVMMMRVPFIGWSWELFLSMFLLVLGFLATIWLAARIYRIGILMYGKKPTFKDLIKWIKYSH